MLKVFKREVEENTDAVQPTGLYPCGVLEILKNVIKKHSRQLIPYLHCIIEIILLCLDPNIPAMRRNC
jgi:hypothetical protein